MTASAGHRRHRAAHRPADGGDNAALPDRSSAGRSETGRSLDDSDLGWGERPPDGENASLLADRPPHHDGRSTT